jgi:hypothetical protein
MVTLDPDVLALLRKAMRERGASQGRPQPGPSETGSPPLLRPRRYRPKTFRMGFRPEARLDRALSLAAALEDEELAKQRAGRNLDEAFARDALRASAHPTP